MRKIDAHAHVGFFGGWCQVGLTAEEMTAEMSRYNIVKSLISFPDNDLVAEAVARYPGRLAGLAWLDPNQGERALAQLENLVARAPFVGLKLHPLFNAFTANDVVVHPLMDYAQARDWPVFIHSGHPPFSLPWSIAQLAEDYPGVRIVMVHMGHGHGVYIQAALDMARRHDNLFLENSGMPMHTKIKEAYERVGSERLFWGSDAPFHHYAVEILRTEVSGLTDSQLEDVFFNNINRFMGW